MMSSLIVLRCNATASFVVCSLIRCTSFRVLILCAAFCLLPTRSLACVARLRGCCRVGVCFFAARRGCVRVGIRSGSAAVPSSMVVRGVFARVTRPWANVVARIRCWLVASTDVDGDGPTLGGEAASTLGSGVSTLGDGLLFIIAVSFSRINACRSFTAMLTVMFSFIDLIRSVAANTVRSSSDKVGVVQCAGYTRYVPVVL